MNFQLKHLRLLLPALLLLFISCQEEYDGLRPAAASFKTVTEEHVSFHELQSKMPKAYAALSFINGNTGALAKGNLYNSRYGFSIDTLEGRILKRGNYHSITYPIYRDIPTSTLENLVISLKKNGNYTATIVQYDLSTDERKTLSTGDGLDLTGKKIIITQIDIASMGSNYSLDSEVICYQSPISVVVSCSEDKHGSWNPDEWHSCTAATKPVMYISLRTLCVEIDTGGGGTGGGGTGGSSGGGSGGTTGTGNPPGMGNPYPPMPINPSAPQAPQDEFDDMLTTPVVSPNVINPPSADPCIELKKMTNNSNIKNTFQTLETKTTLNAEYGFTFHRTPTYDTPTPTPPDPVKTNVLKMPFGGDIIGGNHTHPSPYFDGYPMFSYDDLQYLWVAARYYDDHTADKSIFVLTLTLPQGTYAIKIKDYAKLTIMINGYKDLLDKNLKAKYFTKPATNPTEDFVKDLLSVLNDLDSGVGVYKASPDYSNWAELTLDPTTNAIIKTDCN